MKWTQKANPLLSLILPLPFSGALFVAAADASRRTKRVILCPPTLPFLPLPSLPFSWHAAWMRKMRHSRDLHFVISIFLSDHHSTLSLSHSLTHYSALYTLSTTLPLSLLISLFAPLACAFPSRGTTMKTNAFRTERTQIWNNFLLVKRSKGQEDHLLLPPPFSYPFAVCQRNRAKEM